MSTRAERFYLPILAERRVANPKYRSYNDEEETILQKYNIISDFSERCCGTLLVGSPQAETPAQAMSYMFGQDIRNPNMGVTIFDSGGSLAPDVEREVKNMNRDWSVFCPTSPDCPFFNPLAGEESEVIQIVQGMYRDGKQDVPVYIQDIEKQLLRYTVKLFKRMDKKEGTDGYYSNLLWMDRFLQNKGGQGRELVVVFSRLDSGTADETRENRDMADWFINGYFAENSWVYQKTFALRAKISLLVENRYLKHVFNPDVKKGESSQIDFAKYLSDGGILYLNLDRDKLGEDEADLLSRLLMGNMQDAVLRRKEGSVKAHALYLHEGQYFLHRSFVEVAQRMKAKKVAVTASIPCRPIAEHYLGKQFANMLPELLQNVVLCDQASDDDSDSISPPFSPYDGVYAVLEDVLERFLTSKSGNFDFLYNGI